jgi:hypothetical protein
MKNVVTHIEQDFKGTQTVSLVNQNLPEIRQKDNEVENPISEQMHRISIVTQNQIDVLEAPMQLKFNAPETVANNAINEAIRIIITREIK